MQKNIQYLVSAKIKIKIVLKGALSMISVILMHNYYLPALEIYIQYMKSSIPTNILKEYHKW
jgi:hypothetical protein